MIRGQPTKELMNTLKELAAGCNNGACNPHGIINSLAKAMSDVPFGQARDSIELKIVIGQLSFLLGESAGPTAETQAAYLASL